MWPRERATRRMVLIVCVLPVPPMASAKKRRPELVSMLSSTWSARVRCDVRSVTLRALPFAASASCSSGGMSSSRISLGSAACDALRSADDARRRASSVILMFSRSKSIPTNLTRSSTSSRTQLRTSSSQKATPLLWKRCRKSSPMGSTNCSKRALALFGSLNATM